MKINAGAANPSSRTLRGNSLSVVTSVRCCPKVAHCTAAAGVSASFPPASSDGTIRSSRDIPM